MTRLRSIIVDDEEKGRENLRTLLSDHCPEIEVVGVADSVQEARDLVERLTPTVVFLDINMPIENGFDFLEYFSDRRFSVVFVTAYDQYAVKAIKASAVDYILKPIDLLDLRQAVDKLLTIHNEEPAQKAGPTLARAQVDLLLENLQTPGAFERIILHLPRGIKIVKVSDIVYLKAESNYSNVVLQNGKTVMVSGTLKDYEEILSEDMFFRIHKSYVVNLLHVEEFHHTKNGSVLLSNGARLQVSARRVKDLMTRLQVFVAQAKDFREGL